ncbi:uncharacterized protein LOC111203118 [Brassica napus]|uniref:uncharacterized protein LOC111203118 n=1 Tax=Brassica napus TaxID=3708 RepID=UPI000BBE4E9E|nr:uncharacterized protein LOC111203118 [Brassica napus]
MGLKSAMELELPNAEHRKCVKRIVENVKKNHAKKDLLKPRIWDIARSYTKSEFDYNVRKLQAYDLAFCCEDVDNNATESFNSTITKSRAESMVPMLEMIRKQAMEHIAKRHIASMRHEGVCSKYVAKLLAEEKKIADECVTTPATRGVFEVSVDNDRYNVNTIRHTCSYGKWQISGVPCEHAYGAMIDKGLIVAPPEPDQPGRKKKKKQKKFPTIKGKFESPKKKKKNEVEKLGKAGRTVHCGSCGKFFSWEAGRSETYSAYTKSKLSSSDQVQKKKLVMMINHKA